MSIQLTNINCFYGPQQVLFNISCQIAKGATVALLGPSGAGKSTLLKVFNLLMLPQQGQLSIVDQHIDFSGALSEHQINIIRRQVGMVFQQYHLWPHLTILANLIEAPCRVLKMSRPSAIQQATLLLERLGLAAQAQRYPLQLSGGQQQRVAIARALMMQPRVLLFDEPTAALDPEITAQIALIMDELAQTGITQLLVTHDVEVARKVADWIIYMEQGRIIEQGDAHCFAHPKTEALAYYLSH